jgi:FtsH-binding integral membrane protein
LVGGLSLLFIIMGGYIIMTSRGNPQQLNNGKSYLFYALIGLFLAIFGFLFIEVIAKNLLHIPGFG